MEEDMWSNSMPMPIWLSIDSKLKFQRNDGSYLRVLPEKIGTTLAVTEMSLCPANMRR